MKKKQHKSSQPPASSLPTSAPRSLVPTSDAPLEAYTDYYAQVFESEWQDILKKEEAQKQAAASTLIKKPPPRKPKIHRDPFETPQAPEEKAATEMERWLKLFEKRLTD